MMHIPNSVFMLRPINFSGNGETLSTNRFQKEDTNKDTNLLAQNEFDGLHKKLLNNGVKVHLMEDDKNQILPDAVFLNNWFSIQPDRSLFIYPMYANNRKKEVRNELIQKIQKDFVIKKVVDWRNNSDQYFCEGTGSLVFDHQNALVYACISSRTSPQLVEKIAQELQYKTVVFDAFDLKGAPVYHTNVVMSVGEKHAVICLDAIDNVLERKLVEHQLKSNHKKIIPITHHQMNHFCGNIFEINRVGLSPVWVMSQEAYDHFDDDQIQQLSYNRELIVSDIPTIEKYGGGSVRCMLAGSYI